MAKPWYSLRPNQIIKKSKSLGFTNLTDRLVYTIRNMPEPVSTIADKNWSGKGNWMIKLNDKNFTWLTTSRTSIFQNGKTTGTGGKERTFEIPSGKIQNGKVVMVKIRFVKSSKLAKTTASTAEQERGSAFIFRRALNDDAGWGSWQDIVEDDKTYPELVKIFDGNVPEDWLISYYAQQRVLLDQVKPKKYSEFNRDGGFMKFISDEVKAKKMGGFSQKDNWNPADIWIIKGNQSNLERVVKNTTRGKHQTILELNAVMRQMYHKKVIMGISLKKTGRIAYYEEVNLDGFIRGLTTENYNYDVPMSDFIANFKIEPSTKMFTQDVKIDVNAEREGKVFTFQIKALDSGSSGGQNLKFEPTMKGASSARLGKAPVDKVASLLKDIDGSAEFVNKYQEYPADLDQFEKISQKHNEKYYRDEVLPTLLLGSKKIKSETNNVNDAINAIKQSFDSTKDKKTNVRCKLMALDFFYQVSKLSHVNRNEFITDMVFLAQKKAFSKAQYFGPFGKIY